MSLITVGKISEKTGTKVVPFYQAILIGKSISQKWPFRRLFIPICVPFFTHPGRARGSAAWRRISRLAASRACSSCLKLMGNVFRHKDGRVYVARGDVSNNDHGNTVVSYRWHDKACRLFLKCRRRKQSKPATSGAKIDSKVNDNNWGFAFQNLVRPEKPAY